MTYDAIIVGGSFSGLAAALYLARARRSVCILDTALPRNRFADASHGFFAQDGANPSDLLATMREQVLAYPTVRWINEAVVNASGRKDNFEVVLSGGSVIQGTRLLLAFGVSDILPDLRGLAERWGKSVLHCPYCHGYEVSDRRLGVLYVTPASLQQAQLIAEWGPTTFFFNGAHIDDASLEPLRLRNIEIERSPIEELRGAPGKLAAIQLSDGRTRPLEALFVGPRNRLNSEIAEQVGCQIETGQLGRSLVTDEFKSTTVEGIFAAGDISRTAHNITFACADGVMAAMAIHRSLVWKS